MKFKVGDKVKVVRRSGYMRPYVGMVGTIVKIWHGDICPYELKLPFGSYYFHARELEKVESENGSK